MWFREKFLQNTRIEKSVPQLASPWKKCSDPPWVRTSLWIFFFYVFACPSRKRFLSYFSAWRVIQSPITYLFHLESLAGEHEHPRIRCYSFGRELGWGRHCVIPPICSHIHNLEDHATGPLGFIFDPTYLCMMTHHTKLEYVQKADSTIVGTRSSPLLVSFLSQ